MQSVSDRLRVAIESRKVQQKDLAEKTNIAPQYLSAILGGKRNASERLIKDICTELHISPEWVKNGTGNMEPDPSREQLIAETVANVLNDKPGSFQERVIKLLASLTYEEKVLLENIINTLSGKEDEK